MKYTSVEFEDLLKICDCMAERLKVVENEVQSCYYPSCSDLSAEYFLIRNKFMSGR